MKHRLIALPLLLAACSPAPAATTKTPPAVVVPAVVPPVLQPVAPSPEPQPILVTPTPSGLTLTPNPLLILAPTSVGSGTGVQITPTNPAQPPLIRVQVHGSYSPAFGGADGAPLTANGFGLGPLHGGEVLQVLDSGQWVTFARYE